MPSFAVSPEPPRWKLWVWAARPATLPAAIVPVLVGTAAAASHHSFRPLPFLAALVAALLIQVGTNFANDFYDFKSGADTADRLGPLRIAAAGAVDPGAVLRASVLAFGSAAAIGLYLVAVGGWPILAIGAASIVSAVAYTAGPFPLAYHGLGDLFAFVFFGPVAVMGSYYLQAGSIEPLTVAASIPVGLLVTAILIVNNVRDIEADRVAGKRTLAVRLGRKRTRVQYAGFVAASYAVPVSLGLAGAVSWLFWLPLLTLPIGVSLIRTVGTRTDGPSLNAALRNTGRLHLLFGLLFAASLLA